MIKFLNVGFNNFVPVGKIQAINNVDNAPTKRIINEARKIGKLIDATCGRKTRSAVFTSNYIIVSSVETSTLVSRGEGK